MGVLILSRLSKRREVAHGLSVCAAVFLPYAERVRVWLRLVFALYRHFNPLACGIIDRLHQKPQNVNIQVYRAYRRAFVLFTFQGTKKAEKSRLIIYSFFLLFACLDNFIVHNFAIISHVSTSFFLFTHF